MNVFVVLFGPHLEKAVKVAGGTSLSPCPQFQLMISGIFWYMFYMIKKTSVQLSYAPKAVFCLFRFCHILHVLFMIMISFDLE